MGMGHRLLRGFSREGRDRGIHVATVGEHRIDAARVAHAAISIGFHSQLRVETRAEPTAAAISPSAANANELQASLLRFVGTTGSGGKL